MIWWLQKQHWQLEGVLEQRQLQETLDEDYTLLQYEDIPLKRFILESSGPPSGEKHFPESIPIARGL